MRHLLAERFRAHAPRHLEPSGDTRLDAALRRAFEEARSARPELRIPETEFVGFIAERLPTDCEPLHFLADLRAGDLYLTCACLRGDPQALVVFDKLLSAEVTRQASRGRENVDDLIQRMREKLLVAESGVQPKLASYSGRSALGRWLGAVIARTFIDLARRKKHEVRLDTPLEVRLAGTSADPELQYLKDRYGHELREAFRATVAELPAREANVLQLHFLEAMSAAQIGRMYGVNARTVQRWIANAREWILAGTLRRVGDRFGLETQDAESLLGLARSQLANLPMFLEASKK